MRRVVSFLVGAFILLFVGPIAAGAAEKEKEKHRDSIDPAGIERLQGQTGGRAQVSVSKATGAARFVTIAPDAAGAAGDLMASSKAAPREKSAAFLNEYAGIFGLQDVERELALGREQGDEIGGRHLSYYQVYRGVPVFAGVLKAHFNDGGELTAINGNVVPNIELDVTPSRAATEASATAIAAVRKDNKGREVFARSGVLMVYRTGLAQGVVGENHLAWQFEVGNDTDIREFVYVDAHSGAIVDRLPGIVDALSRRAYDGQFLPTVPPSYPGSPFWVEGQAFPTGVTEADNMLTASRETYNFYKTAFGRDSFDGAGGIMDSIFNRGYSCPNASWNGTFISFCNGLTTDDVTAHEWTHAYTQYTHGLIYQWQSGALNESYSDIFGETVDRINGRGTDTPDVHRTVGLCSRFEVFPPMTRVTAPANIAGDYPSGTSAFSPIILDPGTSGQMIRANDGVADVAGSTLTDGCGPAPSFLSAPNSWANAADVAGKIVLIDRGLCGFAVKALNAQRNGAIGVVIANVATSGNAGIPPNMGGTTGAEAVTIPTASMNFADGEKLRGGLAAGPVSAILKQNSPVTVDDSVRWMIGEDDTAQGLFGPLRDMWTPTCFNNPGKVSDTTFYVCGPGTAANDNGGVHSNSGVPNHAYALMVDGGTYNGQTVTGIGLTKAAHIYYRAMTVYQNPATDFADHADAIERSASDLLGKNLKDLKTGSPSGQKITQADLVQVANAMKAVEMRNDPVQCNFAPPLLAQNPPALCTSGSPETLFVDQFENANASNGQWTVSHAGVTGDFTPRDWTILDVLPSSRPGKAFFGVDEAIGTCAPGGDESGVLHLDSPKIMIPNNVSNPQLTFVHWVATEAGFDGGNVKISVNGGPWLLVAPGDFIYNPYNTTLISAANGNTNPLAGQPAFSGTDDGSTGGTWGRSIVNLAPYAHAGDKVRLRFDLGNDGCGGFYGWFVDDVQVYRCH